MTDFPALTEMGIKRFDEISQYALYSEGQTTDVLKIYYKRAKGSFLPQSRKYRFGRSIKMVPGGRDGRTEMHEISPFLQRAIGELDVLSTRRKSKVDEKVRLLADIDNLERVFKITMGEIRAKIDNLEKG